MEGRMTTAEGTLERVKTFLFNGDDDPEKGVGPRLVKFLTVQEDIEKRRWTRSQKIAVLAILSTVLLPPSAIVVPRIIDFCVTLDSIIQEWHEIHKTEIPQKKSLWEGAPVLQSSHGAPEESGNQSSGYVATTGGKP
jgi:hypothetical protein